VIEFEELLALGFGLTGNIEFGEDEIEELTGVHPGVKEERGASPAVMEPIEKTVDQSGLARADLAREGDKAFASLNAVHQAGQCFLNLLREKEEAWIRINVERVFF